METDESSRVLSFQLQFDKPIASQVKIAEWNPEKDLLAMVTEDSKLLLHRFNWQRLWTVSPGKSISSICWRPDGKAIAVGLEDGTIALHDVEVEKEVDFFISDLIRDLDGNGRLIRSLKSHSAIITCLNWEEDSLLYREDSDYVLRYEDRTHRFFPPAPRIPRIHGLVSGDGGFIDEDEDTFRKLSDSSHQHFNILCSGDKDGNICFSIFGIFPIGKINIHNLTVPTSHAMIAIRRLVNASIHKVSLSKDLCRLIVVCSGELVKDEDDLREMHLNGTHGLHSLALDTSIFWTRKNELHQMAQQASNIEDMIEVMRASLSVMSKQWSDAFLNFQGKFKSLSTLIVDNGIDTSPREEFLSLLDGARPSPPLHQFLVNSLGETGVKRVSKVVCSAGKELQQIVLDHLQPAAEIIAFRIGELRALSKWRARFHGVGLDETLIDNATERAGMLLVQIERYMKVLSSVVQQFSNFFNWLLKSIKLLMSEPSDQVPFYSSEFVVVFLNFLYDQDPVSLLLDASGDVEVEIDLETEQRVRDLVKFGGFSDTEYLRRTLAKEFQQMEFCLKEAFLMPFNTISKKFRCEDLLPLFPLPASQTAPLSVTIPISVSCYEDISDNPNNNANQNRLVEYISFAVPDNSFSVISNCMGIIRGSTHERSCVDEGSCSLEAVLLCIPVDYECVDLSLYKETQIVLLLNKIAASENDGSACIVVLDTIDLPFTSISRSACLDLWKLQELKDSVVHLQLEDGKLRTIPHTAVAPLAVSASRGVACVFASRKRVLVYILEEDEDEISDAE